MAIPPVSKYAPFSRGLCSVSAGAVGAVRRTYSQTKQAIGLRNMGQGTMSLAGVGSAHEENHCRQAIKRRKA